MKKERLLLYGIAALGVGALSIELSRYQFSSGVRNKITRRDKGICQVDGCDNKQVTAHHIIPESCLNQYAVEGAGKYVDELHRIFDEINSELGYVEPTMKHMWAKFIKSSLSNGVSLCPYHHVGLHQDNFDDKQLTLKRNYDHPDRPNALTVKEIGRFIWNTYDQLHCQALVQQKNTKIRHQNT